MYALNSFVRIANFVARSFVGLVIGYILGVLFPLGSVLELLNGHI